VSEHNVAASFHLLPSDKCLVQNLNSFTLIHSAVCHGLFQTEFSVECGLKGKGKASRYRPGVAQRVPGI
jgi:hypothetical protein